MTDEATKITETLALGNRLLEEFGLKELGWKFDLSTHKRIVGQCKHTEKKILYSLYFLNQEKEEIDDTIRHEIAHALVGPRQGHNWLWRSKAIEVGARPERCAPPGTKSTAQHNYEIECDECKRRYPRYRLRKVLATDYVSSCCGAKFNFYRRVKK